MKIHLTVLCLSLLAFTASSSSSSSGRECKVSPGDLAWPSADEWTTLNHTLQGALLRTAPAASSCYPGNPLHSGQNCTSVKNHWSYAAYHATWPESVDYSIYANNSCVPPGADGYSKHKGCNIGGYPQYVVNATTEEQVATAMAWASKRGIRIVVKGTGHDLSGRSTGAYALSIWTHNFNHLQHRAGWRVPGTNESTEVLVCGSGNNWGSAYTFAHQHNRSVVGGEDATVGLGGLIQNGGHGLLSHLYGLASDQVVQVTVVTPDGRRRVANDEQHQDLFWAVRGGGGGQYGVVTEFVLRTHPEPANVVTAGLTLYPGQQSNVSEEASWVALAEAVSLIPDLMDQGLTGTAMVVTKSRAMQYLGLKEPVRGAAAMINLTGFNQTIDAMNATIHALKSRVVAHTRRDVLSISMQAPSSQGYWASIKPDPMASASAGASSMMSSRLMGRRELTEISQSELIGYLQQLLVGQDASSGSMALFGLQAGPGPASVPERQRGSVLPAWRTAYAQVMAYAASVNATGIPRDELHQAAAWYEANTETLWRRWAPSTGSYMNEGNAFSSTWKHDFYGENYDRLLAVKQKYDPSHSLFVWSGVGSDHWDYDLTSGLLCRRDSADKV